MGKCNDIEIDQDLFEFNIILHLLALVQNFSWKVCMLIFEEAYCYFSKGLLT